MSEKQHSLQKHKTLWAGAACAVLALMLALLLMPRESYLVLTNVKTGQAMYCAALDEGELFSVSYTHSVNKSDVEEFYQLRQGELYLVKLVYATFGAGMPTDAYADGGTSLSYDEQGRMVIEGYDRRMPSLVYNVGMVADHILHINGGIIHFTDIDQPQQALRFEIQSWRPWQVWLRGGAT